LRQRAAHSGGFQELFRPLRVAVLKGRNELFRIGRPITVTAIEITELDERLQIERDVTVRFAQRNADRGESFAELESMPGNGDFMHWHPPPFYHTPTIKVKFTSRNTDTSSA
jgi:hypothetical protein